MSIDEMFLKYPNVLFGARINGDNKILDFWNDIHWQSKPTPTINNDDLDDEKEQLPVHFWKKQKDDVAKSRAYYILYSETLNFEQLFALLSEYLDYNLDIERKNALLDAKMEELRTMFNDLNYTEASKVEIKIKK